MTNRKLGNLNDKDFETVLEVGLSEFPPDDIVTAVTPWKKPMNRVLYGMALTAITLNFLCLNYILPAIGTVLQLLGFRALRQENKWFESCFAISIIRGIYLFAILILNTTIFQSAVYALPILPITTMVSMALLLAEFICLGEGFKAVQRKAGLSPHAGAAIALIIWYGFMCLLALFQYNGLIIGIGMIVAYVFIIRNLCRLSTELDEAGYSIQPARIKVNDRAIVISLVSILVVSFICGYTFGGSYPMDWTPCNTSEYSQKKEIVDNLLKLGFPEYVLNDLTAEDIEACDGAIQVVVDVTDKPVNDGRTVTTGYTDSNGVRHTVQDTVYDENELRITGVAVQISGEQEHWMIFHHFLWTVDSKFYGTEAIQLWPVYRDVPEGWASAGEITGRVLYDKDGETFVADYYSLGPQTFTSNSILGGTQSRTDVFATFSMPRNSQHQRGYVAYPIEEVEDGYIISSWFNYTHQRSWLQYPVMTAMEKRMTYGWNDAGAFRTVQDALQFYPNDEEIEMIS